MILDMNDLHKAECILKYIVPFPSHIFNDYQILTALI